MDKEMALRMLTLSNEEEVLLSRFLEHKCNSFSLDSKSDIQCVHYERFKNAYLMASMEK